MSSQTSPRTLSLSIAAAAERSTASLVKNPTPVFSRSKTVAAANCGTSAGCCLAISERATTSRFVNLSIRPLSKECLLGMPILVRIEMAIHTRNVSLSKTADHARCPPRVTNKVADDPAPMPAVGRKADIIRYEAEVRGRRFDRISKPSHHPPSRFPRCRTPPQAPRAPLANRPPRPASGRPRSGRNPSWPLVDAGDRDGIRVRQVARSETPGVEGAKAHSNVGLADKTQAFMKAIPVVPPNVRF